jgi:hypothetical protein
MARLAFVALSVAVLSFATNSDAQPLPAPPPPTKSAWAATGLAVGVTIAGYALGAASEPLERDHPRVATTMLAASFVLSAAGPSAGHLYAGEPGHALRWTAIRGAGLLVGVTGTSVAIHGYDRDQGYWFAAATFATIGLATYAAGLSWDLFDAHRAAGRANRRTAAAQSRIAVTPTMGSSPGLAIVGVF